MPGCSARIMKGVRRVVSQGSVDTVTLPDTVVVVSQVNAAPKNLASLQHSINAQHSSNWLLLSNDKTC